MGNVAARSTPSQADETSLNVGLGRATRNDHEIEENEMAMDNDGLQDRIHGLEVAQATQAAVATGAEATHAAVTAGAHATQAAAQAGTWAVMAVGSVSLIVGIFLGLTISKA